jgi:hypothetical protein
MPRAQRVRDKFLFDDNQKESERNWKYSQKLGSGLKLDQKSILSDKDINPYKSTLTNFNFQNNS